MKLLRKPSYLGTTAQVIELRTLADTAGTYAERHRAARAALGKAFAGQRVGLVRIGASDFVVPAADLASLPKDIRPKSFMTIAQSDASGSISLIPA